VAESLLDLRDILVRHGDKTVLAVPHLEIEAGEVLALLGPNGAGKTTLLRVIGLLQLPDAGTVHFKGVTAGPHDALAIRRRIANVFQEPLLLNATVNENAGLGLKLRGLNHREVESRIRPWLERLGIAHLAARPAHTLSGGEAQRTSLARALAVEPELLLLDEPFAALDPTTREALLRDFQGIIKDTSATTVFVTHDRNEAFVLADRVGVLVGGHLLQLGSREDVFERPESATVAELIGFENRFSGVVEGQCGDQLEIAIGSCRLYAKGQFKSRSRVVACIRAEDVLLDRPGAEVKSMNRVTGRVAAVSPGLARHRIVLDCEAFHLVVGVDRRKCPNLSLRLGDESAAVFDPAIVHIVGHE
jgi:tungstate transport system ATP-binding protein